jgi:hypothetical protein
MNFEEFELKLQRHDKDCKVISSTDFCFTYLMNLAQERMPSSEFETFEMALKLVMRLLEG